VVGMAIAVEIVYFVAKAILHSSNWAVLLAIACGGTIYFVLLLLFGTVSANDLRKLPKVGNRLAKVVERVERRGV